jgi:amino acid transporter
MRIASGVILGYLLFGLSAFALFRITHHDPHAPASLSFELAGTLYGILFALLGGFVASFIGGRRDTLAAKWVAVLIAAGAIISMFGSVAWSNLSALLLMAPSAIFGGWLYRARVLAGERRSGRNHDQ